MKPPSGTLLAAFIVTMFVGVFAMGLTGSSKEYNAYGSTLPGAPEGATACPVTPAAGACGASGGATLTAAPATSTLCSAGTASAVSGSGPWTWTCQGTGGGSSASCSANKGSTSTPVPPTPTTPPSTTRQKIIAEAKKELDAGVCGVNSTSTCRWIPTTSSGGDDNCGEPTKYVKYTCGLPRTKGWAWCAGFAGWVYGHAGVSYPKTCGANVMMNNLRYHYNMGGSKIPKPGDMIQRTNHIGIVYKIEGTNLYTIEGNAGKCVKMIKYTNYGRGSWLRFGNSFEAE